MKGRPACVGWEASTLAPRGCEQWRLARCTGLQILQDHVGVLVEQVPDDLRSTRRRRVLVGSVGCCEAPCANVEEGWAHAHTISAVTP